jgi:hypothetical protein
MSTVGQGSTSYFALPTWTGNGATEVTGGYYVRIKFKVDSLATVNHLVGGSTLRTTTTGALIYRNNTSDLITSSAGSIVAGQIHEAVIRRLYTPTAAIQLELDGVIINTTTNITLGWLGTLNQLGRFSTTARSDITVYEFEVFNGAASYSAIWDQTGATGTGTTWADDTATRNLTITNATGAADSWWIFYSSGSSFTGTMGKTPLSITTKQLLPSLGYSISTGKSSLTLTTDQLSISVGAVLGVGKQSLVLNTKLEDVQLGYVNVLSKQGYNLLTKQLSVVVGANTPFTGTLNKTTYDLSGKQLAISAGLNLDAVKGISTLSTKPLSNVLGWNSGVTKQSLNLTGKQESADLGFMSLMQAFNIVLSNRMLSVQSGTSLPFIGLLDKLSLNLTGKPLSVSAGTSTAFTGLLGKTSLSLSGKQLNAIRGQLLSINTLHLTLTAKVLIISDVVYQVIPKRRARLLSDSDIRLYQLSNISRLFILRR